jgi:hypothetical protein
MILLIILGLIQALILPGLIASYLIKNIAVSDRIVLASTLSLVVNYLIVWLLYLCNLYSQASILVLVGAELFVLWRVRTLVATDLTQLLHGMRQLVGDTCKSKSISFFALLFVLYCIYFFYLLKTNGFLTVFTHWDAVVSWNRWAVELHEGVFKGSRGYPLGMPILFSLIYTISQETNIQTLVKYICVYWPFLGGLALFACGIHAPKLKNVFALAAIFYLYLLSKGSWTIDFVFSGLMDPIMAAFGAICIHHYLVIKSKNSIQRPEYKKIVALVLTSVAGGALVKLTGVILLIDFMVLLGAIIAYDKRLWSHKLYFLSVFLLAFILAVHWYVLTTVYWADWQALSQYNELQDPRVWLRPYLHLLLFAATFGWVFVGLAFIGALSSPKAFAGLVLFIAPLFIFCAIAVGYDLRATFITFAPIAILTALGLSSVYKMSAKIPAVLSPVFANSLELRRLGLVSVSVIALVAGLGSLTQVLSRDKILSSNTEKRILANDFANGGNQRLLQIFATEPKARIVSCWQTPVGLPGAKGRFIPTGDCTVGLLHGWLSDPHTKYWLYRDENNPSQLLPPQVVKQVLSQQPIPVHAESLGSGFVLYSK